MNPEKMGTEYGKLIYLLQDAVSHLGFSVKGPILVESVYKFMEERDGLGVLSDPQIFYGITASPSPSSGIRVQSAPGGEGGMLVTLAAPTECKQT